MSFDPLAPPPKIHPFISALRSLEAEQRARKDGTSPHDPALAEAVAKIILQGLAPRDDAQQLQARIGRLEQTLEQIFEQLSALTDAQREREPPPFFEVRIGNRDPAGNITDLRLYPGKPSGPGSDKRLEEIERIRTEDPDAYANNLPMQQERARLLARRMGMKRPKFREVRAALDENDLQLPDDLAQAVVRGRK